MFNYLRTLRLPPVVTCANELSAIDAINKIAQIAVKYLALIISLLVFIPGLWLSTAISLRSDQSSSP